MQLHNPSILYIGAAILAAGYLVFRLLKRRPRFRKGVKVANTSLIRESGAYKRARFLHAFTGFIIECSLITAILSTLLLLARPYRQESINQGVRKRDIFLCMDTAVYMDTLNMELLDEMIALVDGMNSDRFGVSVHNSSSLLYVPITDDYSYVKKKLEDLKELFRLALKIDQVYGAYGWDLPDALPDSMKEEYEADSIRYEDIYAEIVPATNINKSSKGSFLTGDGLASCMYSFPKFGAEDRSRVILLSTQNSRAVGARPIVTLDEACDLCVSNRVTVFGLFRGEKAFEESLPPNGVTLTSVDLEDDYSTSRANLEMNVRKTGGEIYEYGYSSVAEIIEKIRQQPVMLVNQVIINKEIDRPRLPLLLLTASLVLFSLAAAVRGG